MRNRPIALLLITFIIAAHTAYAEKPDRSTLPGASGETVWSPPPVQTWTMSNGITVWHLEAKGAPLVSLRFITARGAGTDTGDTAGLASFMVDMLDEGAGENDALALSEAFQILATDYAGSASTDGLIFRLEMLADNVDESLGLLADILRHPRLPQKEFERRKAQRLASALSKEANLDVVAGLVRRRVLFGQGYGGLAGSGTRETIKKITLQNIKTAFSALVQPQGATIVTVGSIGRDQLKKSIDRAFGDWSGEPAAVVQESAPAKDYIGLHVVDFPGSAQSIVMLARPVDGSRASDYFSALVFNRPFSGSFTGRVNMNLREDKGYTYGARGRFVRSQSNGAYLIYAKVKRDTTRLSIDEMVKELRAIRGEKPLTEKELANAKGGLRKSFPGRFERISAVAGQLGRLVLDGYASNWYSDWPGSVAKIDLATAKKTGLRYTDPKDFAIIVVGDLSKIGKSLKGLSKSIRYYDTQGRPMPAPAKKSK